MWHDANIFAYEQLRDCLCLTFHCNTSFSAQPFLLNIYLMCLMTDSTTKKLCSSSSTPIGRSPGLGKRQGSGKEPTTWFVFVETCQSGFVSL
jgi:hypothetical protein